MKIRIQIYKLVLPVLLFFISMNASAMFPELTGWKLNRGEKVYVPENLWDIINGAADAYLSYDFQKLYTAEYINEEKGQIRVYIFEHSKPVNAFGIYSMERSSDYELTKTGAQGFKSGESHYFITGPYYVQITGNSVETQKDVDQLANLINLQLNQKNQLPSELDLFPEKGKIPVSDKYIANNFMGYSFLHSAFVASYAVGEEKFQIFIINPEEEKETDKILTSYLDFVKFPKESRGKAQYSVEDPYNGEVLICKSGKYLLGIFGSTGEVREEYMKLVKTGL